MRNSVYGMTAKQIVEHATKYNIDISVVRSHLRRGRCPYPRILEDGKTSHQYYRLYSSIKTRCYDVNSKGYTSYGLRGVRMEAKWLVDFWSFVRYIDEVLGERPIGWSLDRINNDGNYEPGNIRWASSETQNQNRRGPSNRSGIKGLRFKDGAWEYRRQVSKYRIHRRFKTKDEALQFIQEVNSETPSNQPSYNESDGVSGSRAAG